jgi:hypothetical protein
VRTRIVTKAVSSILFADGYDLNAVFRNNTDVTHPFALNTKRPYDLGVPGFLESLDKHETELLRIV